MKRKIQLTATISVFLLLLIIQSFRVVVGYNKLKEITKQKGIRYITLMSEIAEGLFMEESLDAIQIRLERSAKLIGVSTLAYDSEFEQDVAMIGDFGNFEREIVMQDTIYSFAREIILQKYLPDTGTVLWMKMKIDAFSVIREELSFFTIGIIFTIIFAFGLSRFLQHIVVTPLMLIVDKVEDIATGKSDLTERIELDIKDEIGVLVEVFNIMMEKLQDSIEKSENIITSISDPMFTTDNEMNVTYFNEAALLLSGYSLDDAIGKNCEIIFPNTQKYLQRVQIEDEAILNIRLLFEDGQGEILTLMSSFSPLRSAYGEAIGGIVIMRDISRDLLIEREISSIVQQLNTSSTEVLTNTQSQVEGITKQASSLNETTITAEEMAATAALIAENSESVVLVAEQTQNITQEGFKTINNAIESMLKIKERVQLVSERMTMLREHSTQIGGITEIINEISSQINLLALNAAIEAAGAGETGRRFNVVATEMRRLAEKTVEATQQIKILIDEIQDFITKTVKEATNATQQVDEGSILTGKAGEVFRDVISSMEQTTSAAQRIGISTQEQKSATEQMTMTIYSINEISLQVQTGIKETTKAMERLKALSNQLENLVAHNQ